MTDGDGERRRTSRDRICGSRDVDWPLFAILGGDRDRRVVHRPRRPEPGHPLGRARLDGRRARRLRRLPSPVRPRADRTTVKAPPAFGPALALEYRRLLVPVIAGQPSDDAMDVACSLAAERGARIVAVERRRGAARARRRQPARRHSSARPNASSTRRSRSATPTASAPSAAWRGRAPPPRRSWTRRARATARSS